MTAAISIQAIEPTEADCRVSLQYESQEPGPPLRGTTFPSSLEFLLDMWLHFPGGGLRDPVMLDLEDS